MARRSTVKFLGVTTRARLLPVSAALWCPLIDLLSQEEAGRILNTPLRIPKTLKGDDAAYAALESKIVSLTNRRNEIAGQMIAMLEGAAFNGQEVDEGAAKRLIEEADELLQSIGSID